MNIKLNQNNNLCPACGEGRLHPIIDAENVEYKGVTASIEYHFSQCDICSSELAGKDEASLNNRAMTAFYKQVDGLLSGHEILEIRERYNLTQKMAASLFGGGEVAFSRYERNEVSQNTAMDSLIRLCKVNPHNFLLLAEIKNVKLTLKQKANIEAEYQQGIIGNVAQIQQMLEEDLTSKYGKTQLTCANDPFYNNSNINEWQWSAAR